MVAATTTYGISLEKRPDYWAPRPEYYNAETSPLGYVRLSKWLIEADFPVEWGPREIKLWIFLLSKLNLRAPHSYHRVNWKEAQRFCGGTKSQLGDALANLVVYSIDTKEPPPDLGYGSNPVFRVVLRNEFRNEVNLTDLMYDGQLCWTFHPYMISALADVEAGWGRIQFETIRKIKSLAALRLFMVACLMEHSRKKASDWFWTPAEMARFFGNPDMRIDNMKDRVIPEAIAELKAVGAIHDYAPEQALYTRETGRGRRISAIRFQFMAPVWKKTFSPAWMHYFALFEAAIDGTKDEKTRQNLIESLAAEKARASTPGARAPGDLRGVSLDGTLCR